MIKTKEEFIKQYNYIAKALFGRGPEHLDTRDRYTVLAALIRREAYDRSGELEGGKEGKKVYYFSMEFLIGKLMENYLLNLGIRKTAEEGLRELGIEIEDLFECEPDPGLGNGGLGRLAACFLDSMAALDIPGDGMGLRYKFGLFKQRIESGYQLELPDAWLDEGYPWETAKPYDSVIVRFGGKVERTMVNGKMNYKHVDYTTIRAVPYDVPVIGFGGRTVNTLHLWDAQPVHDSIDMDAFNAGDYSRAMAERSQIEAITSILYPDDTNGIGKQLRLRQEYFLVAAGIGRIVKEYKDRYGDSEWDRLPDRIQIHINDTHPTMCIPELMRVLIDEEGVEWKDAWEITKKTVSFTNHTVLPEALEKWPIPHFQQLLPRIYMIIDEINRRWQTELPQNVADFHDISMGTSALWDNEIRMANLSVIGSHSVNGVSALHSDILTKTVFKEFYELNPKKFNNKTNGISHRRFMMQANPGLADLIDRTIGDEWQTDFDQIKKLEAYAQDSAFLDDLMKVKRDNKLRLAKYISDNMEIDVDPDSVFDVQVKRMHAYKRQLLNAFKILDLYNRLKEDPDLPIRDHTFIFAGKAAQGYAFAKEVIKFVNSLADIINSDPVVSKRIKVVFIENFRVSNAQLIYPAADISEQISTAGKEASGTGNMKFMMNGAVTLGTMDGANVEISQLAGMDNICIFGYSSEEVENFYRRGGYSAQGCVDQDPRLARIVTQLVDGTFKSCGYDFWGIHDALMRSNDEYFVLGDFDSYVKTWEEMGRIYGDKERWARMSLANIANSSFFSSDRTIREYADDIWNI
ncbi:MAG: glycogen/starch/alpha-glucan phosphorylase [Clostridiales bacterium]|jgi:starch phosphorylase|nr:glycogen/starch/alpha-glucan phosphorylase [Clostridiales bacterium]